MAMSPLPEMMMTGAGWLRALSSLRISSPDLPGRDQAYAIGKARDLVAAPRQQHCQEIADRRVVIDDKNLA
jgi:hypothetical protein